MEACAELQALLAAPGAEVDGGRPSPCALGACAQSGRQLWLFPLCEVGTWGSRAPPSARGRRAGMRAQGMRASGWQEFAGERAVLCAGKNMSAIIKEVCDGSSLANHECFALQHADSSNFYITEKNRNEIKNGTILRLTTSPPIPEIAEDYEALIASFVNKSAMDISILQRSLAILESMVLNSHDLYQKVAQEITIGQLIPHLQGTDQEIQTCTIAVINALFLKAPDERRQVDVDNNVDILGCPLTEMANILVQKQLRSIILTHVILAQRAINNEMAHQLYVLPSAHLQPPGRQYDDQNGPPGSVPLRFVLVYAVPDVLCSRLAPYHLSLSSTSGFFGGQLEIRVSWTFLPELALNCYPQISASLKETSYLNFEELLLMQRLNLIIAAAAWRNASPCIPGITRNLASLIMSTLPWTSPRLLLGCWLLTTCCTSPNITKMRIFSPHSTCDCPQLAQWKKGSLAFLHLVASLA
ncbi:uncharacterized protein [Dipodomys merriami]|uniref:uncharacterized protein n=1 Tax=Dipodomys merriami TaxID=94247 RepID=UPI003855828C